MRNVFRPARIRRLDRAWTLPVVAPRGPRVELLDGGRLVRERWRSDGELTVASEPDGDLRTGLGAGRATSAPPRSRQRRRDRAVHDRHPRHRRSCRRSVRLAARAAARRSRRGIPVSAITAASRCWPAHPEPEDMLLISPIILYDHPEVAEQSDTALFDCTEIDEILTLRVMTMTDEEKAQARATDPRAAQIIDQCDAMSPEAMARLHGVLRDPHGPEIAAGLVPEIPEGIDWWDPLADNAVRPELDAVLVQRDPGRAGQPGPVAATAQRRRAGHLRRRQDRPRHFGARGRRGQQARRGGRRRRPRRRPARVVRPLSVLLPRRSRAVGSRAKRTNGLKGDPTWRS